MEITKDSVAKCQIMMTVDRGYHIRKCLSPVVGPDRQGEMVCKRHLAAEKRRLASEEKDAAKRAAVATRREELHSIIAELGCGQIAWEFRGEQSRNIAITPAEAVAIINKLRGAANADA